MLFYKHATTVNEAFLHGLDPHMLYCNQTIFLYIRSVTNCDLSTYLLRYAMCCSKQSSLRDGFPIKGNFSHIFHFRCECPRDSVSVYVAPPLPEMDSSHQTSAF